MILVPEGDSRQRGAGDEMDVSAPNLEETSKGNKIRRYAAERQRKLLSIVLKLASKQLYDSAGRIDTTRGKVEITPLLLYALSPGRTYPALDEFVDLLHKAGVTPDEVINGSVKEMLRARYQHQQPYQQPLPSSPPPSQLHDALVSNPERPPTPPQNSVMSTQSPQETLAAIDRMAVIAKRRLARRPTKEPVQDHYDMLKLAGVPVPQKRPLDEDEGSNSDKRQRIWRPYSNDES